MTRNAGVKSTGIFCAKRRISLILLESTRILGIIHNKNSKNTANRQEERKMWIKGFVHEDIDNAFLANVQIVSKWTADHRAGVNVGYMEFTDGTNAEVFRHPGGTYYGYITKEE